MENRQRTPLALAIEEIKKNKYMFELDKQYSIDIIESLKPKEREMFEKSVDDTVHYITGQENKLYSQIYFKTNLTQE